MRIEELERWNRRFVAFVSSTIRYATITFLRNHRRYAQRHLSVMDRHIVAAEPIFLSSHSDLSSAWAELSPKQQMILQQKYESGYSDIEIAGKLHLSPQAIGKLRRQALEQMRAYLTKNLKQEVIPHQTQ